MTVHTASEIVISGDRVYHLGLAKGELAPNVFFVGDPARAKRVAERFDRIDTEVSNREFVTITGKYREMPVSVMGTGIGTDNVEIAIVEAFVLHEFDLSTGLRIPAVPPMNIIRIGTSGGVQNSIGSGALGITTYALGLDSTGLYYDHEAPDGLCLRMEERCRELMDGATPEGARFRGRLFPYASKASERVSQALVKHARDQGSRHALGITVSAPGFYGPSGRYLDGLRNTVPDIKRKLAELEVEGHRIINFEMESSLIFHLAHRLGYNAGTICPIISGPSDSAALVDYHSCIEESISIGMEAMYDVGTGG